MRRPLLRALLRRLPGFARSERGIAALEFALALPVLMLVSFTAFECAHAMKDARQLEQAADAIAAMLAQSADGKIGDTEMHMTMDSIGLVFPELLAAAKAQDRTDWWNLAGVTISSVAFTPTVPGCTSACTYKATTQFSVVQGGGTKRCGTLASAPDTAALSSTTLPASLFQAGTSIVVDVTFGFQPLSSTRWFPAIAMRRSAYATPRNVAAISYVGTDFGSGTCP